jgi:hypothetical protein
MNLIGFDVSKVELIGVRIDRSGRKQEEYILDNSNEPIESLLVQL